MDDFWIELTPTFDPLDIKFYYFKVSSLWMSYKDFFLYNVAIISIFYNYIELNQMNID